MGSILNAILSLIPGNGSKTILGFLGTILPLITNYIQDGTIQAALHDVLTKDWPALLLLVVGLVHKPIKAAAAA